MARIRSIYPGLFVDDAFMELSMAARVLLMGIWVQCDDHGIFEFRPKSLKAAIFPGDDGIDMAALLKELSDEQCIRSFEIDGKGYGAARNFCKYQHPKKPTYYYPVRKAEITDLPPWVRSWVSFGAEVEDQLPTNSLKEKDKEREKEKDTPKTTTENLERVAPAEPPAPPSETLSPVSSNARERPPKPPSVGIGKPLPPDWTPNDQLCEEVKSAFGMTDADLASELPAFHALNVQNGTISPNWNSTFYLFCKRWREHRDKQAAPRVQLNRAPPSAPRFVPTDADWDAAAKLYAATGRWPKGHGPDPMSTGCKCPREILEKHEINPETGDRRIPPRKVPA